MLAPVVDDVEAFHPAAHGDEVEVVGRARGFLLGVVHRDGAAQNDTRAHVQSPEHLVEDPATDVIEIDVDPLWTGFLERFAEPVVLVVDARIEAEVLDDVAALFVAARDPNRATAFDLGNLTRHGAGCPRGCRNDHRFAFLGLAHRDEPRIGGNPGRTENPECVPRIHRARKRGGKRLVVEQGVLLPTHEVRHDVTDLVPVALRLDHAARHCRTYDPAYLDGWQVALRRREPGANRRVDSHVERLEESLALFELRDRLLVGSEIILGRKTHGAFC